jgi:hypothetical protein
MLAAQSAKPSGMVGALHGGITTDPSQPSCSPKTGCLLTEDDVVALKFAAGVNSKTAREGDPVEFLLDDDLKVAGSIVIAKGTHAVAIVTDAKKAGMRGRPGELSVPMQCVFSASNHVRIRGTKGRQGDSKTGTTVVDRPVRSHWPHLTRQKFGHSRRNRTHGLRGSGHLARADQLTRRSVRARLIASRAALSATESVTKMSE